MRVHIMYMFTCVNVYMGMYTHTYIHIAYCPNPNVEPHQRVTSANKLADKFGVADHYIALLPPVNSGTEVRAHQAKGMLHPPSQLCIIICGSGCGACVGSSAPAASSELAASCRHINTHINECPTSDHFIRI